MSIVAFVDESWSRTGPYILGAVVTTTIDHRDEVREAMRNLNKGNSGKLHFHKERKPNRRRQIARTLASLPAGYLVATDTMGSAAPPERRRRQAMRSLIGGLVDLEVDSAVFESRGPQDKLDRQMLQHLRVNRELNRPLRMDFAKGPAEPCLFAADAMCGIVAQHHAGVSELLEVVGPRIRYCADRYSAAWLDPGDVEELDVA